MHIRINNEERFIEIDGHAINKDCCELFSAIGRAFNFDYEEDYDGRAWKKFSDLKEFRSCRRLIKDIIHFIKTRYDWRPLLEYVCI